MTRKNVEIKAKVQNVDKLLEAIKALNPLKTEIIKQHDTFYNVLNGRLKLRMFENDEKELIFYDRKDIRGVKISSYKKLSVCDNCTDLYQILNLALGPSKVVKKVRQVFIVGQTRIHLDNVEHLGNFIELEVVLEDDETLLGEQIANNLMNKLGINKEDLVAGAYADML